MSCHRVLPDVLAPGDDVVITRHLRLEPLPHLVGEARKFVLSRSPALPPGTCDVLVLLTSELVTNAVLHARTPLEVGLTVTTHSILVTVYDLNLTRPVEQPYPARAGGWGLGLVSALAEDSGLRVHTEGGKTAWFRLSRDAPSADWTTGSARRSQVSTPDGA